MPSNSELRIANSEKTPAGPAARRAPAAARRDIEERTFRFAVRVLRVVNAMPRTIANAVLARQVARSGTSIGANVEEAQGSHSRAEFVRRMGIARSEARETHFWLRLVRETSGLKPAKLTPIVDEALELVRILTTIVKRARTAG